jgi:hypothetical protein
VGIFGEIAVLTRGWACRDLREGSILRHELLANVSPNEVILF